jgi:hypothetical protein
MLFDSGQRHPVLLGVKQQVAAFVGAVKVANVENAPAAGASPISAHFNARTF